MKLAEILSALILLVSTNVQASCQTQADTPLIQALQKGDLQTASSLIKSGHSPDETGRYCFTPLESARSVQAVTMLLDAGANINKQDGPGATALLHATRNKNIEVVRLLLKRGANPDIYNESGRTPLIAAAESGWIDGLTALLDSGADINRHEEFTVAKRAAGAVLSPFMPSHGSRE